MTAAFGALPTRVLQMFWLDPDETAYAANVTVWIRWLFWAGAVLELAYRPEFTAAKYIPFMLMHVPLITLNGYVHYRLNIFNVINSVSSRVEPYHSAFLAAMLRWSLTSDRRLFDEFWRVAAPDWQVPGREGRHPYGG